MLSSSRAAGEGPTRSVEQPVRRADPSPAARDDIPLRIMIEYATTSRIDAPPAAVWAILTDASRYAEWNPEIIAIEGTMALGQRIIARVRLGDGAIRKVP